MPQIRVLPQPGPVWWLASFHRLDGALGLVAAAWQLGLRTSVAPKRPELRGAATGGRRATKVFDG